MTRFKKIYGHCNVTRGYETTDGFKLAIWVNEQRANKNKLPKDRLEKISKLGLDLDPSRNQKNDLINELIIFKKQYGHSNVPREYKTGDGYPLGRKVKALRSSRTLKSMSAPFKKQLASLGFVFNLYSDDELATGRPKTKS